MHSLTFRMSARAAWISALALLVGLNAAAETPAATPSAAPPSAPLGTPLWELGGFALGVSQQAYPGADQQVQRALALPFFVYRGSVLRADRETAGIRAIKTETFELDVGVAAAFGASSNDIEARRGMRDLGTLVELGPRLKWKLSSSGDQPGGGAAAGPSSGRWRAEFPLRAVFDLSDGAAHRGWSFEPELVFERQARGGWAYSTSVSALVADRQLARTFYEVNSAEANRTRAAYAARSGLVAWRLSASASRSLGPDWRLFGFARVDTVAGAANEASPLVRQTAGTTLGLGVAYTWLRSAQRARD